MPDRYGATLEAWTLYQSLGLTSDLLPVVSDPAATISANSKIQALGKTPTRFNTQGEVVGIAEWTKRQSSTSDIERWSIDPRLGISIQCRTLCAFDIDIADPDKATAVGQLIGEAVGFTKFPIRYREGTGKCLIPFWYLDPPLYKHVIPVDGGMVEVLGQGQQFIAEGTHPSGTRYEWSGEWEGTPRLDSVDFAMVLAALKKVATGEIRIARERREGKATNLVVKDDVVDWLLANWETYNVGSKEQLDIACPFREEHTGDSSDSSTSYFPAGTGGYHQGHFVCMHAHCAGRDDSEFLSAIGYSAAQFPDIGDPATDPVDEGVEQSGEGEPAARDPGPGSSLVEEGARTWPALQRDKTGILPTMDNMLKAVACPSMIHRFIAYDAFKAELVWAWCSVPWEEAQWQPFGDRDYALIRQQLEQRGFKPMGMDLLRLAIFTVGGDNEFDTAVEWLERQSWDGVSRVETFCRDVWGWVDSPYSRAVSRYVWTALAGRVLQPGVRADMAPILVGNQGIRKTTAIQMMVPSEDFYAEVRFDAKDDDLARLMRGKLVGELGELRGLNSRAIEDIKTFITRRHEHWVPKFKEFATRYWRRLIFFGTTNEDEILADDTGERRWLPGMCGELNIELLLETRDQLWAEGRALFALDGVDWREAELLAKAEHSKFKVSDAWEPNVLRWLTDPHALLKGCPADQPHLTTGDVLSGALGMLPAQIDRGKMMRVGKILKGLGYERKKVRIEGDTLGWGYVRL